jgi:hypothetical protein
MSTRMGTRMAALSSIAAALALGACASTSGNVPTKPVAASQPAGCVSGTGSRIPAPPGNCAGFGNVYSQEDLKRTGQTTAGDALGLLDPTITVNH